MSDLIKVTLSFKISEALKMLAETLKAAVFAHCQKIINVTQGTPVNKNNQRSISGINAWIPRWNSPGATSSQDPTSAEPISKSNEH